MNRIVMSMHLSARFSAHLLAVFALPLLAACQPDAAPPPPPLEGAAIGGPFELISETGDTVRWSDFDGQYRMVYFGYTWCPDVCPFDLNRMMLGYRLWAGANPDLASQVQPIFITIDPERDTPEVIAEYTDNFGEQLLGLTGSAEAINQAAMNFSVFYARGEDDANLGYVMQHSNAGYLMGREGQPIALLPVDETPQAVAEQLTLWVK